MALVLLVLRSFTQGAAALTGVEAISNGVPAFRKPKSKNAATTLLLLGLLSVTMFMGLIALAQLTGVKIAEDPAVQFPDAPPGYEQHTMIAQLAEAVFAQFRPGFFFVIIMTALILVLAANTAFNGFPVLGSILSQDRYLPRQLHTRGDRLAFSNGIVILAAFAVVLVIGFQAEVTRLIPLYTVGVFVSFTLSQTGMVRHWRRHLLTETDPGERRRMRRAQAINGFGAVMTGVVLVTVLITKFLLGAWIAIAAMAGFYVLMIAIKRHYDRVAEELVATDVDTVLPSRNHAIVLVARLHRPTLRAISYARATRPDVLEAVTVNVDDADTRRLVREWDQRKMPVSLKVVESPYREITKPVLDYVKRVRTKNPRDVVTVFVPEYVVGHWWEQRAAQPECSADQDPPAVPAGRDGGIGAVAAQVVRAGRRAGRADPRRLPPGLPDGAARRPAGGPVAVRTARRRGPRIRPEGRRGRPGRRGTAAIMSRPAQGRPEPAHDGGGARRQ